MNIGGHWQLDGELKRDDTGIPPLPLNTRGSGELVLVRRIDALSPHISVAHANQFVIPKLTVTIPSGAQVTFQNVRVNSKNDTNELEQIKFTFQKIEISGKRSKKSYSDDWLASG